MGSGEAQASVNGCFLVGDEVRREAQRRCRIGPPVHGVVIPDVQRPQGRGPAGHLSLDRA